jgi:hypothetical protein
MKINCRVPQRGFRGDRKSYILHAQRKEGKAERDTGIAK